MDRLEAHQILYQGQSNVQLMAWELGCSLEDLQQSFRQYVSENSITDDAWRRDVELAWPFA